MAIAELSYDITADASELVDAANEADAELESMAESTRDAAEAAKELEEATDSAEEATEGFGASMKETRAATTLARTALGGIAAQFPDIEKEAKAAASAVGGASQAFRALSVATGLTLGPVLAVVAAIAAIIAIGVALHYAWRTNWNGMQDVVKGVATSIRGYLGQAFDAAKKAVVGFVTFAADGMVLLIETAEKLAKVLGVDISGAAQLGKELAAWAKHLTTDEGFSELIDDAKVTASTLKDGVVTAAKGFGSEMKRIIKELGLDKLFGRAGGGGVADAAQSIAKLGDAADDAASEWKAWTPPVEKPLSAPPLVQADVKPVKEAISAFASAIKIGGGIIASKLGDVGQIISSAATGFSSGGPWGAVIAVIAEVVTRLKGFQLVVDSVNKFLERGLERINKAFGSTFDTIVKLAESVGYLIEVIADATGGFRVIGAILSIVGQTLSFLSIGILYVVEAIMVAIIRFGHMMGQNMDAMAKEQQKISLELVMQQAKHKEWNLFGKDDPQEVAKAGKKASDGIVRESDRNTAAIDANTEAHNDLTKAAKDAAESLTNIPSGYKVATARFNALDADIPHMASGGIVTAPTLALIGEAGPEAVVPLGGGMGGNVYIENLTVVSNDPDRVRDQLKRDAFIKTGASVATAPQWVGG